MKQLAGLVGSIVIALAATWLGGVLIDAGPRCNKTVRCKFCRERYAYFACADCGRNLCPECVCGHQCGAMLEVES